MVDADRTGGGNDIDLRAAPDHTTWWSGFFTGLWLEVQRRTKTPELTVREIDFVEQAHQVPPGSRIVDAPCGVGRHAIELAARGHTVTGLDITDSFVDDARAAARARGLDVGFEVADMRDLPTDETLDVVTCLWGSFGYFDDDGNRAHVEAAFRALRPGGQFIFDTHTIETLLHRTAEPRVWRQVDDIMILEDRHFDVGTSRTVTDWTLLRGTERFDDTTSIRLYSYREIVELLEDCGFQVERTFGTLDRDPFDRGSDRLYVGARRPG